MNSTNAGKTENKPVRSGYMKTIIKDTATLNDIYDYVDYFMEDHDFAECAPIWVYELDNQRLKYEREIEKLKLELKNKEREYENDIAYYKCCLKYAVKE